MAFDFPQIAAVMSKHGLQELFGRSDEPGAAGRRRQAKRLRAALEELGPTYAKLGQVLSTLARRQFFK